jgi:glycosyltransferase involved in cell wall biosynthesis
MYFACPSIAPSVGGIPEVVQDRITGLLVPFGDSVMMAHAVENLIQDAELRRKLGLAAFERARNQFSADIIVSQYESFYRRICGKPGSAIERLSFVEANHFKGHE